MRLDDVANLGTDSVPDLVQRGIEDSAERLDGDMGESAGRLGEWCSEIVGTVHELREVVIPSDAVVIGYPFVGVGTVLGNNGRLGGN